MKLTEQEAGLIRRALDNASESLTNLDPLGEEHDATLLDEALKLVRIRIRESA